jgi:hypothetical protein
MNGFWVCSVEMEWSDETCQSHERPWTTKRMTVDQDGVEMEVSGKYDEGNFNWLPSNKLATCPHIVLDLPFRDNILIMTTVQKIKVRPQVFIPRSLLTSLHRKSKMRWYAL